MLFSQTTFIGIDPSAGEKPYNFAAVSQDLQLLALGSGGLPDILAFAAGQQSALAAICGPQRPNTGLMADEDIRQQLLPRPNPGRYENFRVAEYQLRLHNISIPQTPALEEDCPNWMRNAFLLFTRMKGFGYRLFPGGEALCQVLEVYPHACFSALLGIIPFQKYTLEGRIQRQLALRENGMNLPDAMNFFEEITRHRLLQRHPAAREIVQPWRAGCPGSSVHRLESRYPAGADYKSRAPGRGGSLYPGGRAEAGVSLDIFTREE